MANRRNLLKKTLLSLAVCSINTSIAFASGSAPKKVALIIGNAAYASSEKLKNPVSDATLTVNSLKQLGFATTLATDRTTIQLKSDLQTFSLAAKDADIALLFYAGHGIAVDNINYLIPVDQRLSALKSLDLKRDGISLRWIESILAQSNAQVSVVVIDACRNPLMRGASTQGMVDPANPPHGALTFYSTAPGTQAGDGSGKNSEFSMAFNRNLLKPDLSLMQVVMATQADVSKATGDTQIPWVSSGLVNDVQLSTAKPLAKLAKTDRNAVAGVQRGSEGKQEPVALQKYWDENLARLDEAIQYNAMNVDANSKITLEKRAKSGDVLALTTLGLIYATPEQVSVNTVHTGYGLESKTVKKGKGVVAYNPALAVKYLNQATAKHFPVAQTLLAELLVQGPPGVPRDYQRAEKLLKEAASSGYGRARLDLIDLNTRRGNYNPHELAKELMNNSSTIKNYVDRWSMPQPTK
jgi:hypothetical protein